MLKLKEGTLPDRLAHILFYNHITPQSTTGLSPAELLQNKRLRSRLDLIKPDLQARIEKKQSQQLRSVSRDRTFQSGDLVYICNFSNGPKWLPGVIQSPCGSVSYEVTLEDGRSFRRHEDHIRIRWNDPEATLPTVPTTAVLPPLIEPTIPLPHTVLADPSDPRVAKRWRVDKGGRVDKGVRVDKGGRVDKGRRMDEGVRVDKGGRVNKGGRVDKGRRMDEGSMQNVIRCMLLCSV